MNLQYQVHLRSLIFSDLQEILLTGITIDQHYDRVINTSGNFYKGCSKSNYENVIKALQTIIESRRKHLRKCNKQKEAIAFLHQKMKFSPTLIRNMVELFGVRLEIPKILKTSSNVLAKMPQPKWLRNIGGTTLC